MYFFDSLNLEKCGLIRQPPKLIFFNAIMQELIKENQVTLWGHHFLFQFMRELNPFLEMIKLKITEKSSY